MTAKEIANLLGGELEGDGNVFVDRPGKIEEGGEGTLTFLGNPKYEHFVYTTRSSVLLTDRSFDPSKPIAATALIRVDNVYDAVRLLLEIIGAQEQSDGRISESAFVHEGAVLGEGVSIGVCAVIDNGVTIGDGTIIYPQVYIGENVEIGKGCVLYPGVRICAGCKIGSNCILHANVVVGADGFGFAPQEDGSYRKIPQIGNVVIEDQVEIGANSTIDRAVMGSTIIRKGAKIDNLVMVAHNVEIGENTVIAAQAGIAGSTSIGRQCRIGGQAGFVGHVQIADGTQVQAQSGVAATIKEPNQAVYGSPAMGYRDYLKSYAVFKKLPDLYKKINDLEKQLRDQ